MNTSASRFALVLSILGVCLAALALQQTLGGTRDKTPSPRPDSAPPGEDLARRTTALDNEVAALRSEIASLRAALERELAAQGAEPRWNAREPSEVLTPAARAADSPAEFELRRELIHGFHALDAGDRKDALEELASLARWGDEEARALLVESLSDESASVRARALKELAALDKASLGEHLRATVHDASPKVREVVASYLDKLPAEEAGPMLVDMLSDPDSKVVLSAIQSIDALRYEAARPFLVRQLQSDSLDVATRAGQALIKLGDTGAALSTIQRVMKDYVKDDVSGRVNNVKRLRRLRAVSELESILASDTSLAVREEARDALARIED